jgi:glycosyltransferase involved in cell wall biosynthesis
VSTTIGAEGLEIHPPKDIRIADTPEAFAAACLELLGDDRIRDDMAAAGLELVQSKFSWDVVTREFERMLMQ